MPRQFSRKTPLAELHCHLGGAVTQAACIELAADDAQQRRLDLDVLELVLGAWPGDKAHDLFGNLVPGTYSVGFTTPVDSVLSPANRGA